MTQRHATSSLDCCSGATCTTTPPLRRSPAVRRCAIPLALVGLLVAPTAGRRERRPRRPSRCARGRTPPPLPDRHRRRAGRDVRQPAVAAAAHEYRPLHRSLGRGRAPVLARQGAASGSSAAEAQHQQVLVAFYHSEYTPTKMPSVAQYQHDVQKFVKLFPHVRQYQSWDEANRGNIPQRPREPLGGGGGQVLPGADPRLQGLHGDRAGRARRSTTSARPCTTSPNSSTRSGDCETVMPKIWGLHNYSDINRLESWRTRELITRPRRPGVADRDRRDRAVRRRFPEQATARV